MSKHSEACCTIPPVVDKDYRAQGKYITMNDMRAYAVGPTTATKAILVIFDIFGFWPQTLQGADILAQLATDQPYRVFMPDFFDDQPAELEWYPAKDDDTKKKLADFFAGPAEPQKAIRRLREFVAAAKKENPGLTKWGVVGFCWGGKIVVNVCGEDTPFSVAAQCHPAMVDAEDGKKIMIPLVMLPSKDEDPKAVKAFEQSLNVRHQVEVFDDQAHGWMTAHADLSDPHVKSEYERGYKTVLTFFHDVLSS
ncbi:MAG: hypothetical protein M1826_003083 [Phylliscum demangeonii]|nr:MAG: hypothetical protein M1826_003083 [Phylliscum demangeonii]